MSTTSSNISTASTANSVEERALELLGMGFEQVHVANALAVTESRISQLLSDELFVKRLAELKYKQLAKHNETDNILDGIEKKLAQKLDSVIPLMFRPQEIVNALARVNAMKRRGSSSPDALTRTKPTVKLNIPIAIVNRFQMNAAGQVISAGIVDESGAVSDVQDLVTIQSSNIKELVNEHLSKAPNPVLNLKESDGVRFRRAQGREFHDVLEECGFSVEVNVPAPVNVVASGRVSSS